MSEIKLPFGKTAKGLMVSIGEVLRGLACECFCPQCDTALVAVKGEIVRHHFRHHAELNVCNGARETALHMFAKQLICESLQLALPHDLGPMRSARQEVWLEGVRPDVLAGYDSEEVAIEVWVAHQVPADKVKVYAKRHITALEIDLRAHRYADHDDNEWREIILDSAPREWLVPPAKVREEERRRRLAELAEQRKREREAHKALKEAEWLLSIENERRRQAAAAREVELAKERAEREAEQLKRQEEAEKTAEVAAALDRHRQKNLVPPDLQDLVRAHGTYSQIPPEAWAQWDADVAAYQKLMRAGARYQTSWWRP